MNEMLRKRMSATQQASEQQTGDAAYERIEVWQAWYRGKVPAFHTYRQYNGKRKLTRQRRSLGMAKAVAEDWANLALNEKVEICIKGKQLEKRVREVLENNNFRVRGNQLLEETFALGTGAFVERMDGDDVRIDYVRAGMIYPLAWHNGAITECAFASERQVQKEKQVYLNIHRMEHGKYVVENHLFRRTGDQLTEMTWGSNKLHFIRPCASSRPAARRRPHCVQAAKRSPVSDGTAFWPVWVYICFRKSRRLKTSSSV